MLLLLILYYVQHTEYFIAYKMKLYTFNSIRNYSTFRPSFISTILICTMQQLTAVSVTPKTDNLGRGIDLTCWLYSMHLKGCSYAS